MEASPSSSTSKVAVTYWDPAALYQLIQPDLRSRLPLRNLHWKSPVRPLRSIDCLHVDLIPYSPPATNLSTPANEELTRVRSTDSTGSIDLGRNRNRSSSRVRGPPTRKERRHQIPGLRNTPYLKLYILRCDDNDSYKNTQRKLLREWVSTHAMAPPGDNHDAFEWLIVHVVLPGTPAAQQPRSSSAAGNSGSGPRWMKTGTLLDKIRSDFNGSGPKAVDRIIQVRIPPSHPALNTLSPPVDPKAATSPPESPSDNEEAWLDLIAKFKSQILSSFDARVSQYEEDVKGKDAQRALPGWNFCTFFVLKEGLARAFESVGLVEDALVLYDELGFGLEAIVKEQDKGEVIGGKFIGWTKEGLNWLEEARKSLKARKSTENDGKPVKEIDENQAIDAEKKPYRELILSNEISIFDFRCYLFARQATMLLRLGRRLQDQNAKPGDQFNEDDLSRLAEVCNRGLAFITTVARVLRADLNAGYQGSTEHPEDKGDDPVVSQYELRAVIDNLVTSWTYSACIQLLSQTASSALPAGLDENTNRGLLPRRSSSISPEALSFAQAIQGKITGLEELASGRAELMLLARTVVEEAVAKRGWEGRNHWYGVCGTDEPAEMTEVDLNDDTPAKPKHVAIWLPEGIRNRDLKTVLDAENAQKFYDLFGDLSEKAMRYYGVAKRYKSAERVESDLAALKFHLGKYEESAAHLRRMTNFYSEQGWGLIETTLLCIYAKCLKEMQKPKEYLGVLLRLLYKAAAAENSRFQRRTGKFDVDMAILPYSASSHANSNLNVRGFALEVYQLSKELSEVITAPIINIWTEIYVDPYPRYLADKDGFEVEIKMRYLLDEALHVDRICVKLVSTTSPLKEITLDTTHVPEMKKGGVTVSVYTSMTIPGIYVVESMTISCGKVAFTHEFMAKSEPGSLLGLTTSTSVTPPTKKTKIHMFPSVRGLSARLEMPKIIRLESIRSVEIVLCSGENNILGGEMRIKPATAGLRLITGSLRVLAGEDVVEVDTEMPSKLHLGVGPPGSEIRLSLPYSSETELSEIAIRIECDYATKDGTFTYVNAISTPIALPLAVNVQDVFKANALYSKFQVCTAANTDVPLRLSSIVLEESASFTTESGAGTSGSMTVYEKQPANFVYKIRRKPGSTGTDPMLLKVEYTNIDEEIRHTISTLFEQSLADAGLAQYTHFLLPPLLSRFQLPPRLLLESAALLNELDLGPYAAYPFTPSLSAINPHTGDRARVESFLTNFFATNQTLTLCAPSTLSVIARSIMIPVSVPPLQVVHTVALNLRCDQHTTLDAPYLPPMVTVGQTMCGELVIRHTRTWDPNPISENMEFCYEIQNQTDTWLVSGRRRAHFVGKPNGNEVRFGLLLVPCKSGDLALPEVVVQCVGVGEGEGRLERAQQVACETDYRGGASTVLVLPDVRSTTVRIDPGFGLEVRGGVVG